MSIRIITAALALAVGVAGASAQDRTRADPARGRDAWTARAAPPVRGVIEARGPAQQPSWWPREEAGVVIGKDPAQSSM